jgi:hypothetical protein
MQYLLTEEEYKNLVPIDKLRQAEKDALDAGKELIDEIGCAKRTGYCDDCPLASNYTACVEYRDFSQ